MNAADIGLLTGVLVITLLLNPALHHTFRKVEGATKRAVYVAVMGTVVVVGVTTFTMGFTTGVSTYLPAVALWFLIDLLLAQRKRPSRPASGNSGPTP